MKRTAVRALASIAIAMLLCFACGYAESPYTEAEKNILFGLIGKHSITVVGDCEQNGFDIGLSDFSPANIEAVKSVIENEGIDTQFLTFYYSSGFNPWAVADDVYGMIGKYSITAIHETSSGFDIGLSDFSPANIDAVKSALCSMGIDTQFFTFRDDSGNNPQAVANNLDEYAMTPEPGDASTAPYVTYVMIALAALALTGAVIAHRKAKTNAK